MTPSDHFQGEACSETDLTIQKAIAFNQFLTNFGGTHSAKICSYWRCDVDHEVLCIEIETERPQICVADIRRIESLAVVFSRKDIDAPRVFVMRGDFPQVPHLNLTFSDEPRSICLYAEPYESVRLQWTPLSFLRRIQHWFSHTAQGDLHGKDQPLEPLMTTPRGWVILPKNIDQSVLPKSYEFARVENGDAKRHVFVAMKDAGRSGDSRTKFLSLAFTASPQTHGVISHCPRTLGELYDLLVAGGFDLFDILANFIMLEFGKSIPSTSSSSRLMLILSLPKRRNAGDEVIESVEKIAFLVDVTLLQIGLDLDVLSSVSGQPTRALILGSRKPDVDRLRAYIVEGMNCLSELSSEDARLMAGDTNNSKKLAAIGAGALGSQVTLNLVRCGFSNWVVFDGDLFFPHNLARHAYFGEGGGFNKAQILESIGNSVLCDAKIKGVQENINVFDAAAPADLLDGVDIICDFAASIPVSRWLAQRTDAARCLSAYIVPDGKAVVLLLEDTDRTVRLDWLEMLQYRAILQIPQLSNMLREIPEGLRYGLSCRDVSFVLAQDSVALWAALTSKFIRRSCNYKQARAEIFTETSENNVDHHELSVSKISRVVRGDWTLIYDEWLTNKLRDRRLEKLPSETGGVLIGAFDFSSYSIYIVDALDAPPDSVESSAFFERGMAGLAQRLELILKITQNQLSYVGEWHSHPRQCGNEMSAQDVLSITWQVEKMVHESLPAVMLIVGDEGLTLNLAEVVG